MRISPVAHFARDENEGLSLGKESVAVIQSHPQDGINRWRYGLSLRIVDALEEEIFGVPKEIEAEALRLMDGHMREVINRYL